MERTNSPQPSKNVYAVVNNIPSFYRSADLRRFFSQFVETRGFDCFHFRHRPEKQSVKEQQKEASTSVEKHDSSVKSLTTAGAPKSETFCCIIRLSDTKFVELTRTYHQRNWQNSKGESMASKCLISRLKISSQSQCVDLEKDDDSTSTSSSTVPKYQTRGEKRNIPPDREEFREEDLLKIPELRPPTVMPHGNVGTPTMHFIKLIQECRLPPSIIKKLQLDFPKSRNKGKYGNVPFDYHTEVVEAMSHVEAERSQCISCDQDCEFSTLPTEESVHIAKSANSSSFSENVDASASGTDAVMTRMEPPQPETSPQPTTTSSLDYKEKRRLKKLAKRERRKLMAENIEEKMIAFERGGSGSEDDNDTCEEWERHEAMYDDVTNQGRNKDRLFEEEMEVVWEKGGSGLVFYTDAQYWQEKEGDFDEQTADDLDVDMSAYYEAGAGDRDIRDFLTIRQEQRRRRGVEKTDRFSAGIGKFEQHTKGFGRKMLEKQGWKDGCGLGSSVQGIADALDSEGQLPRDRKGLGYRGEKLIKYGISTAKRKRKADSDVIISTVYDNPEETDPLEPLHRRNDPSHIKHRDRLN